MSTWQKACIYPLLYMNHPVPADSIIYNHTLHFPIFIETFTCKYGFLFQSKVIQINFFFWNSTWHPESYIYLYFFVILKRLIIIRFHMLIRVHSLHAIHCVCWCEVIIACQLNCFLSGKGGGSTQISVWFQSCLISNSLAILLWYHLVIINS